MSMPRLSISGLMAAILIVALDFGIGSAPNRPPLMSMPLTELLIIGGFPMANVLAFGLLGRLAAGRRPPRVGFLSLGLLAWLAVLTFALLATEPTYNSVRGAVRASVVTPGLFLAAFVAVLFLLPQLAFASLGGWLGRSVDRDRPVHGKASKPQLDSSEA